MIATVARICRYPVKGLSAETLEYVDLVAGAGVPGDRMFGLALAPARSETGAPQWLPKTSFLQLARNERLGALETAYDAASDTLTIRRDGREVVRASLSTPIGRSLVEQFFDAFLKREIAGKPKLIRAASGQMFTDDSEPLLSIVNLASVTDLERVVKAPVDPLRFRANLYLEGAPAWAEFGWQGRTLTAGAARLTVDSPIPRCAATSVRPGSGERDLNIVQALQRGYEHTDCGIYARVVADGRLALGDEITIG